MNRKTVTLAAALVASASGNVWQAVSENTTQQLPSVVLVSQAIQAPGDFHLLKDDSGMEVKGTFHKTFARPDSTVWTIAGFPEGMAMVVRPATHMILVWTEGDSTRADRWLGRNLLHTGNSLTRREWLMLAGADTLYWGNIQFAENAESICFIASYAEHPGGLDQ